LEWILPRKPGREIKTMAPAWSLEVELSDVFSHAIPSQGVAVTRNGMAQIKLVKLQHFLSQAISLTAGYYNYGIVCLCMTLPCFLSLCPDLWPVIRIWWASRPFSSSHASSTTLLSSTDVHTEHYLTRTYNFDFIVKLSNTREVRRLFTGHIGNIINPGCWSLVTWPRPPYPLYFSPQNWG